MNEPGRSAMRSAGVAGSAGFAAAGWAAPATAGSPSFSSGQSAARLETVMADVSLTGVGAASPAISVEAATPKAPSAPAPASPSRDHAQIG
ncbi:hypothetical protein ACU4GR_07320 [Methylobacterium oryzae CBMB20]